MQSPHVSRLPARTPSRPSYPSDTHLLVEACIASALEAAGLEDVVDVVLPPLPVAAPRRAVAVFSKSETHDLATLGAVGVHAPPPTLGAPLVAAAEATSSPRGRARWPLVLCGFVAGAFACASLLASPVGRKPAVADAAASARGHAAHAVLATAAVLGAWY